MSQPLMFPDKSRFPISHAGDFADDFEDYFDNDLTDVLDGFSIRSAMERIDYAGNDILDLDFEPQFTLPGDLINENPDSIRSAFENWDS